MILKLGTQCSLSGYSPLSWWMYVLSIFKRRHSSGIPQQYFAGVRYFDLVFSERDGVWFGSDGWILYKVSLEATISFLRSVASPSDPVYFRLVCDSSHYSCSAKDLADSAKPLLDDATPGSLIVTCVVDNIKT